MSLSQLYTLFPKGFVTLRFHCTSSPQSPKGLHPISKLTRDHVSARDGGPNEQHVSYRRVRGRRKKQKKRKTAKKGKANLEIVVRDKLMTLQM